MTEFDILRLQAHLDPVSEYDGPSDIRPFADFLPYIGEVVIAFSRLERRLTWGLQACLRISRDEADAIQETVTSVATRIGMFHTLARGNVPSSQVLSSRLDGIVKRLRKLNDYRNFILHGPWTGTSHRYASDGALKERAVMKSKYAQLGAQSLKSSQRLHTKEEMRENALAMFSLGADIQKWVLEVFPHAENCVP